MFVARPHNPPIAIALMLLATMFIAGTMLLAKAVGSGALGPPLHPLQVSHGRFLFAFLGIAGVAAVLRPRIVAPRWRFHAARSLFGWAGASMMFAAVAFIPLSDATAISFLNPVFAMILAIPLLGERVGRVRWSAAAIALAGAMILLRPGPDSFQPAALLALGAAALLSVEITCVKWLSGREAPFQILLINNGIGLVLSTLAVIAVWQPPSAGQWAALAGIGMLMLLAQICYVNSVARADSSLVVPFSYATLVFAALYDILIFGILPDAVSLIGAGTILAGAALLAWREGRPARPIA